MHGFTKINQTRCQWMSFGTGALKIGGEPGQIQGYQGGIHGNPVSRNHPCMQPSTGIVTLKGIQGNLLT